MYYKGCEKLSGDVGYKYDAGKLFFRINVSSTDFYMIPVIVDTWYRALY